MCPCANLRAAAVHKGERPALGRGAIVYKAAQCREERVGERLISTDVQRLEDTAASVVENCAALPTCLQDVGLSQRIAQQYGKIGNTWITRHQMCTNYDHARRVHTVKNLENGCFLQGPMKHLWLCFPTPQRCHETGTVRKWRCTS